MKLSNFKKFRIRSNIDNINYLNEGYEYILEGGNAIKSARGIRQDEVQKTIDDIHKKLFIKILDLDDSEWCMLGSAGKKAKPEDLSGDLDVGIFIGKIAKTFECELNTQTIAKKLSVIIKQHFPQVEICPNPGLGIVSVGWPIQSKNGGFVQTDLMLSDNIEWTKFAWHSPDLGKLESKYKGAYRNILLSCIVSSYVFEEEKANDDTDKIKKGDVLKIDKYSFDLIRGLTRVVKSFVGKKGNIVKTATTLSRALETNVPDEFIKRILGDSFTVKDANSFESLLAVINNKKFRNHDKKDEIIKNYIKSLEGFEFPIPEEIKN